MYLYFPVFWENGIVAATSLRAGGVSPAPYESLNMGLHTDDDPENVLKNRARFFKSLKINFRNIVTLKQVHGNRVVSVKGSDKGKGAVSYDESLAEADAMITQDRGLPMVTFTADCMPIFFAEIKGGIIAMAHSGRQGALKNIALQVVKKIIEKGGKAEHIIVGLGAAIQSCCYQVQEDVASLFEKQYIRQSQDGLYLDMHDLIRDNLLKAGIAREHIYSCDICTACQTQLCYSYRKEHTTGRMASVIMLCQ